MSNDDGSSHHQHLSEVESGIIKKKLVSEQDRNEIQMQMDSLYEDIEVVSEGEDSLSDYGDNSIPTKLEMKNSKACDKIASPNFDNYFSSPSDDRIRSPSVPNLYSLSATPSDDSDHKKTNSMPNLSREAQLEQLRFIQSMNFCQNFSSIINEQYDVCIFQ